MSLPWLARPWLRVRPIANNSDPRLPRPTVTSRIPLRYCIPISAGVLLLSFVSSGEPYFFVDSLTVGSRVYYNILDTCPKAPLCAGIMSTKRAVAAQLVSIGKRKAKSLVESPYALVSVIVFCVWCCCWWWCYLLFVFCCFGVTSSVFCFCVMSKSDAYPLRPDDYDACASIRNRKDDNRPECDWNQGGLCAD